MTLFLSLFYLNLLFYNCQNIILTIDTPKEIQSDEVIPITGKISNGSNGKISFWDYHLHNSVYRGDINWKIIITKEKQEFYISKVFYGKTTLPNVIKLKENEEFLFEIPVSFNNLSMDGIFPLDKIESGIYQVQLLVSIKNPRNTIIKSNIVTFNLVE